mgnify:FL=1
MKKYLIIICFLTCWLGASAQNLREVWINMPDTISPYLNKNLRTELVDDVKMGVEPAVKNLLDDTTRIDRITKDYMLVRLSDASSMEIKLLDNSTIALVQTWKGPVAESKLSLFNQQWQSRAMAILPQETIEKPDTINEIEWNDIKSLMTPRLRELHLNADENSLLVSFNYPLLSKDDRKRVEPYIKPMVLHWTGKDFR